MTRKRHLSLVPNSQETVPHQPVARCTEEYDAGFMRGTIQRILESHDTSPPLLVKLGYRALQWEYVDDPSLRVGQMRVRASCMAPSERATIQLMTSDISTRQHHQVSLIATRDLPYVQLTSKSSSFIADNANKDVLPFDVGTVATRLEMLVALNYLSVLYGEAEFDIPAVGHLEAIESMGFTVHPLAAQWLS